VDEVVKDTTKLSIEPKEDAILENKPAIIKESKSKLSEQNALVVEKKDTSLELKPPQEAENKMTETATHEMPEMI